MQNIDDYKIEYIPLGESVKGKPLRAKHFYRSGKPNVLFLGGVHGDEIEGVWLMLEFARRLREDYRYKNVSVIVMPIVNPDGVEKVTRQNANRIDLNRNLPTRDWTNVAKSERYFPGEKPCSEPENKAIVELISRFKPVAILSAHSFTEFQININGSQRIVANVRKWAESFQPLCGYAITEDIGYPTPGSLGTYAGKELEIPTITLEIKKDLSQTDVIKTFIPVLEQALSYWDKG